MSCTKIIIKISYSHMHYLQKTSVLIWNFLGSISLCIINVYHFTTICILEVENKLLAQMYLCHYTRSAEAFNKSTPNSHIYMKKFTIPERFPAMATKTKSNFQKLSVKQSQFLSIKKLKLKLKFNQYYIKIFRPIVRMRSDERRDWVLV